MLNLNTNIMLIAFAGAGIHCFIQRARLTHGELIDVVLLYLLFFCVGVIASIGFVGHVFFADQTAKMIGWAPGSPFQFEVGFHDGAWGLLGFLCLRWRDKFWLATGIGWSFFLFGATYGHIKQTILHSDFTAYNAGIIFPDLLIPIVLLFFLFLKFRSKLF